MLLSLSSLALLLSLSHVDVDVVFVVVVESRCHFCCCRHRLSCCCCYCSLFLNYSTSRRNIWYRALYCTIRCSRVNPRIIISSELCMCVSSDPVPKPVMALLHAAVFVGVASYRNQRRMAGWCPTTPTFLRDVARKWSSFFLFKMQYIIFNLDLTHINICQCKQRFHWWLFLNQVHSWS